MEMTILKDWQLKKNCDENNDFIWSWVKYLTYFNKLYNTQYISVALFSDVRKFIGSANNFEQTLDVCHNFGKCCQFKGIVCSTQAYWDWKANYFFHIESKPYYAGQEWPLQ